MEKHKDEDAPDSTVQESSKEKKASDHVTGGDTEKNQVVEPAVSEVQVQAQDVSKENSIEGVEVEVGGCCNGENCKSPRQMGSEKDTEDLDAGVDESGHSGSKKVSNLGTESEVGKSCGVTESKEDKLLDGHGKTVGDAGPVDSAGEAIQVVSKNVDVDKGEEGLEGGSGNEDVNSQDIRVPENEIYVERVENGVEDSSAIISSSVGEARVSTLEKSEQAEVVTDKAKETYCSGEDVPEKVSTLEKSEPAEEIVDKAKETNSGGENAPQDSETEKVVTLEKSQSSEDVVDKAKETNSSGEDAPQDSETEKTGILRNEVRNPGIETAIPPSSPVAEDFNVETQVAEGDVVMVDDETLNSKSKAAFGENHVSDVVDSDSTEKDAIANTTSKSSDGKIESVEDKHGSDVLESGKSSSEQDSDSTKNDVIPDAVAESFDGHRQVTEDVKVASMENNKVSGGAGLEEKHGSDVVEGNIPGSGKGLDITENDAFAYTISKPLDGEIASTDNEDITIEGMDTDAFNENFCFSVEELQAPVETANGSTEYHYDAFADSHSSQQPTQLAVGGDIVGKDRNIIVGEFDSSWVDSNVDTPVTDTEQAGSQKDEIKTAHESTGKQKDEVKTAHGSTGKDWELKPEMSLDVSAASSPTQGQVSRVGKLGRDEKMEVEQDLEARRVSEIESDVRKDTAVDDVPDSEKVGFHEGQEMEVEEPDTNSEEYKNSEEKSTKQAALKAHQATYQLRRDDEGEFAVSDLVWGKVRSHPWWPGQIFDPSDASEKAMKHHKKDCFLVAYFGDRTFAWNEASLLKPFRSYFSQVEKQTSSETFQNAVNCALEEVSRRVEVGLACPCIAADAYHKIRHQIVENAGIQQESSTRDGRHNSMGADLFEPGKLVDYMKALAQSPVSGADRIDIAIAESQLLSFYRFKGYSDLPEFQFCGGWAENAGTLNSEGELIADKSPDDGQISSGQQIEQTQRSSYHKRKHNLKDTVYPRKKERSMNDLIGELWDSVDDEIGSDGKASNRLVSPSSGKKRRGPDSFSDDSEGRKTISLAKVCTLTNFPKPSFKIGECICRVASQMTGSPSILKSNSQKVERSSDGLVADGSDEDAEMKRSAVPTEYSSLDELLSQLYSTACDPLKGYSFLTVIVSFFSDFRNAVTMEQQEKVGSKRRQPVSGSPQTFEFEDMNDTYLTDRVIQNGAEEQTVRKNRKRDNQLAVVDSDKPVNKSNSRKRHSDGNHVVATEKPVNYVDENAPAELVMHFPVVDCVPSETSLIRMFKRFGSLKESETEVDKPTNRARVVFKKCSDAEAAYGSASKFNIFGSMLVNYQLNYNITVPFKTEPVVSLPGEEDATLFLQC